MKTETDLKQQLLQEVGLLYINEKEFLFRLQKMASFSLGKVVDSYLYQIIENHKLQCYRLEGILTALNEELPSHSRKMNSSRTKLGTQLADYQPVIALAELTGSAEIVRLLKHASIKKRDFRTIPLELIGHALAAA
ncbi:MAG: hypothetical protein HY015_05980 [Bacteroidetes bacterium]|nr:hypothetical protein [Bacteroidota bacterium]MBI3482511.1 hypothetical protein [Bacteroidota bacterium]